MDVRVNVLGVGVDTSEGREFGAFCEAGMLRVGEVLRTATDASGTQRTVALEVREIRFFDRHVPEVGETYSVNLVLAGDAVSEVEVGWTLAT
jgi:hypothetical protein